MKTIFKIHPLYYIVALICIFTGLFRDFIYISLLIFIHEVGHTVAALYYKWNIKKIVILPFGGITIFNELVNKSLKEEFVILVLGPLFQILFYYILVFFNIKDYLITSYHYSLLLFNLLPIIPLDGSKLLNILLNKIFSFKLSHSLTIIVSLLAIILSIIKVLFIRNLLFFIIIFFLLIKNMDEVKMHRFLFNKFLFERYIYNFNFRKTKIINGIDLQKMQKDKKHLFYDNIYYSEKEILSRHYMRDKLEKTIH